MINLVDISYVQWAYQVLHAVCRYVKPARLKSKRKRVKKRKNPNRLLFRKQRDRRTIVSCAGVLMARANRKVGRMLDVKHVVVTKGGFLSKQGIRRQHSMGISWSYSKGQRMNLSLDATKPLEQYNRARATVGPSHANLPARWDKTAKNAPNFGPVRPRPEDAVDGKERGESKAAENNDSENGNPNSAKPPSSKPSAKRQKNSHSVPEPVLG